MKKSLLVLSAASLAASSALAQTYSATNDPCVKASASLTTAAALAEMPKYCRPEVTLYITGATAQASYMVGTALPDKWFKSYFTIFEGNGETATQLSASARKGDSNSRGWFGIGKDGTAAAGKRLYVAYNPKGSIEGVMTVLSQKGTEPEATWIYPMGTAGKCVAGTGTASSSYYCNSYLGMKSGLALSDVHPAEADIAWVKDPNGGKLKTYDPTKLVSQAVGIQAFGLIVNNNFYKALRDRDIARGYLPASCDSEAYSGVTTVTSACRPTMSRHEYASLIATDGATDLSFLLGASGADKNLVVDRRYGGSGTQASSNIFFLNNPCAGRGFTSTTAKGSDGLGLTTDRADKVISNSYGGGLIPRPGKPGSTSATFSAEGYGKISVVEWVSSSDMRTDKGVASTTDFHIAVNNVASDDATGWKWIKLDGVDPIGSDTTGFKSGATTSTGAAVAPFNYNLRTGRYPFAMVAYTVLPAGTKSTTTDKASLLAQQVPPLLAKPDVSLNGMASLPKNAADSTALMKGTLSRAGGNNCAPLKYHTGA